MRHGVDTGSVNMGYTSANCLMPTPTPHRFLLWVALGGAAACAALQALAQYPRADELQKVETHVGRNHWLNALRELRDLKLPDEAKLTWLETKAEEGSVPAQFELSAMLHRRDFESSLKWYAR